MHRKHLLLGFILGLATGAYYHWTHKDTPKGQDSLYKLVARVKGKVAEARAPGTELHAHIEQAADKVQDVAQATGAKVQHLAEEAKSKTDAAARGVEDGVDQVHEA